MGLGPRWWPPLAAAVVRRAGGANDRARGPPRATKTPPSPLPRSSSTAWDGPRRAPRTAT
eukprot:4002217-Lingulodinium_polyedra.AAC.1